VANTAHARRLRNKETWAENLMWRWLRDRRFSGYKFRRQHPIGEYYLDFFCEEAELAIELDGRQHGYPNQQSHDTEREKLLKSRGIKTLRFGTRTCAATLKVSGTRFSTNYKNAHRVLCLITRDRLRTRKNKESFPAIF
jgi:very-short-patch-repair endonuclease